MGAVPEQERGTAAAGLLHDTDRHSSDRKVTLYGVFQQTAAVSRVRCQSYFFYIRRNTYSWVRERMNTIGQGSGPTSVPPHNLDCTPPFPLTPSTKWECRYGNRDRDRDREIEIERACRRNGN
jgi:hypothetical protein